MVLAGTPALEAPSLRPPPASRVIQRHVSFEHRMLGDGRTTDLVTISAGGADRDSLLANQLQLIDLWQTNPSQVNESDVTNLCPWIRTVRLGPDNVLATYGELNALPDYLPDAPSFDSVDPQLLLSILQVIRQEGHNKLNKLRTNNDPNIQFTGSACAPWKLSMVNTFAETQALDLATSGLGPSGQDHFQGLLARNACHFAPFSWYR